MTWRGRMRPLKKVESGLLLLLGFVFLVASELNAQKKPLDTDDIDSWKRITERVISPDGRWIAYKTEPWKGNSKIYLYNRKGEKQFEHDCGTGIKITGDSEFLIFTIKPEYEHVRELKLRNSENPDMPGDLLGMLSIRTGNLSLITNIKNYRIPKKWAGWLAYQVEAQSDAAEEDKIKEIGKKKESEKNGYRLNLRNLENGAIRSWPFVTEFHFAERAEKMVFVSTGDDEEWMAGIYLFDFETGQVNPVITGQNDYKQITLSEKGDMLAFLLKPYGERTRRGFSLYVWNGQGSAKEMVNNNSQGMPENWRISENGRISYSDNGKRIFFGIAPMRPERDTDILDDEFPNVDIWHGGEGLLHTVQLVNRNHQLTRAYLAALNLVDDTLIQIETEDVPQSRLLEKGNADVVLLHSSKPYELQSMWDPLHYDVYLLDLTTGKRRFIKKDIGTVIHASPGGKYLFWFNYDDYSYYTYHIASGKEYRITETAIIRAEIETNTTFDQNEPYGSPGWLEDDRAVLIYDRYDIWRVDPENNHEPINLTISGRKDNVVYRLIKFNNETDSLNEHETQYLIATNEMSRSSGYYRLNLKKGPALERLIEGEYRLSIPIKAENSDTVVYTKETFNMFPDLLISNLKFRDSIRISDANPQQHNFLWGTAELYEWTSLDGRKLEGLLYKPEGFDPSLKYPMIVQFFHKSSSELYYYRIPEFHSSRIDYHYYTSNGYVIFNPDIYFDPGYVGESSYKSIMSGVTALVNEGFIDPNRIGAQGHSYSGYQLAYIATRTQMFACIQAGAPVVNFFSAYGGIRWETGRSRAFQYEHHQTLGSIWEVPLRFFENSPLFFMDKVTTPILIMHNDQDGAVPWSQGIEYFISLRRLKKPVWMLNYNGEPHGLRKLKNKRDFHIRMVQFFGHYLKGEPMPRWMKIGVPAVEKDYNLGYEYVK